MQFTIRILIRICLFFSFIFLFTLLYCIIGKQNLNDSFYISVTTGTFSGADINENDENSHKIKTLCSIQTFIMYIIIIIMLGNTC